MEAGPGLRKDHRTLAKKIGYKKLVILGGFDQIGFLISRKNSGSSAQCYGRDYGKERLTTKVPA